MRVAVTLDKVRWEVDVASTLDSARVRGHSFPVKVVSATGPRVELEIAGERVVIEGWPEGLTVPPRELALNGEVVKVTTERIEGGTAETPPAPAPAPPTAAPPAPPSTGEGVDVTPPMPGRVVELRVREGDRVAKGQVVVVLEAMKMRNEVASPAAGIVRDVRVQAGGNVRAREPMLRIVPA